MRERTEQMIHSMNKNRHKRRRINAFITALAVLTGGNVFWELRETGMAVTEDDLCTMEAHEHSDNCYDSDGTLICGMDEHIHTADCYSDAEADTETPEVWEMSFTAPENAARQEQAALIAESQLGYTESTDNFILSENGVKQGYTRYGEWYGNPYGDWNTMFTYFCMYYAGVSAEEFPYGGNATTWQAKLKESELLHSPDSEPQRGNIILLDTDADGEADLTGIITDTEELLTVIEGDCDNTVAEVKYQYDDSQILGYVALPEPDTPAEAEAVPMEFSAESPSGIQVSASAEKGTFPEDAVMAVSDISREEAMQAAENLESQTIDAVAVDITFTDAEGTEIEPAEDKTVQVQITLPDEMKLSGDEYSLLHVSDDGDVQKVEEAEVTENGAEFEAEGFSMYVLTSNQPVDVNNAIMLNGNAGNNSADNPFVIGVGEIIEVWYDGADFASCSSTVDNNKDGTVLVRYDSFCTYEPNRGFHREEDGKQKAKFTASLPTPNQEDYVCIKFVNSNQNVVGQLYVKVEDKNVYYVDGNNRTPIEQALTNNKININKNDTFTLSVNGYHYNDFIISDNSVLVIPQNNEYLYSNGNTNIPFTGKNEGVSTITINNKTITVYVGNPPYIKNGTTRQALDDYLRENFYYSEWSHGGERVIYAYRDDVFTVSVNGYAYDLIGIENNNIISKPENNVTLYEDGNTFIPITCNNIGVSHIYFKNRVTYSNETPVTVVVRDHSNDIYMKHNGSRELIENVLSEENKYDYRDPLTIYALEDEKFTLSLNGNNGYELARKDDNTWKGEYDLSEYIHRGAPTYTDGNTYVEFKCLKYTDSNGTIIHNVNNRDVKVIISHPMYVKTNLMDRDIDRVTEWVSTQSWMPKRNGYNPNSEKYPYQMFDNDTMELHAPKQHLSNASFEIGTTYYYVEEEYEEGGKKLTRTVRHDYTTGTALTNNSSSSDNDNIYASFTAHNQTNYDLIVPVYLKDGNDTVRTMYVKIPKSGHELLDHADIEIADGGKYTLTKIERHNDGSFTKIVTEYKAYINGVNNSKLYQNANDTCQFYKTVNNALVAYDSSVTGYTENQYWVDPTVEVGSTQYEFTSKYNLQTGYWSNTKYYADDVDHVVFDVKIALEPSKKTVYTKNSNSASWGEGVTTEITATSENTKHLDSVKFNMDHQDVLDAFNKCPNHTGLDFTIMAYSAMVEFDLNKELTGGTVAENQFTFEVLQKEVRPARKGYVNDNTNKSNYEDLTSKGMTFKGAYRIFYDQDTKWGEGIDKDAALREIQATPEFQNLTTAANIFNIANNDTQPERQAKMIKILKQYLTTPDPDTVITETAYQLGHDGFYLLSFESEPIQTVQNDADGHITFNALHFEKEDSYKYIIREKVPENTNNILYDRKELDLDITVSKNDKQLTADITSDMTNFKFTNHTTYRLPDTGGKGVIPYIVGGAAMMGAALMLLHRKRKEA